MDLFKGWFEQAKEAVRAFYTLPDADTAQAALRGFGTWWMDLPGQGWFNDAAIWEQIVRLRPVDEALARRAAPLNIMNNVW